MIMISSRYKEVVIQEVGRKVKNVASVPISKAKRPTMSVSMKVKKVKVMTRKIVLMISIR